MVEPTKTYKCKICLASIVTNDIPYCPVCDSEDTMELVEEEVIEND